MKLSELWLEQRELSNHCSVSFLGSKKLRLSSFQRLAENAVFTEMLKRDEHALSLLIGEKFYSSSPISFAAEGKKDLASVIFFEEMNRLITVDVGGVTLNYNDLGLGNLVETVKISWNASYWGGAVGQKEATVDVLSCLLLGWTNSSCEILYSFLESDEFLTLNLDGKKRDDLLKKVIGFCEKNKLPFLVLKHNPVWVFFDALKTHNKVPVVSWLALWNLCSLLNDGFEADWLLKSFSVLDQPQVISQAGIVDPLRVSERFFLLHLLILVSFKNEVNAPEMVKFYTKTLFHYGYATVADFFNSLKGRLMRENNEDFHLIDDGLKTLKTIAYILAKSRGNDKSALEFVAAVESSRASVVLEAEREKVYYLNLPMRLREKVIQKNEILDEPSTHKYFIAFYSYVSLVLKYFIAKELNLEVNESYSLSSEMSQLNRLDENYLNNLKFSTEVPGFYLHLPGVDLTKEQECFVLSNLDDVLDEIEESISHDFLQEDVEEIMNVVDVLSQKTLDKMSAKITQNVILEQVLIEVAEEAIEMTEGVDLSMSGNFKL